MRRNPVPRSSSLFEVPLRAARQSTYSLTSSVGESLNDFTANYADVTIVFIHRITSFLKLNENWDSYNAAKPDSLAIRKAIQFVKAFDRFNIYPFFTAPGPNGEILVEFKNQNRSTEAYFNPDGSSEFILYIHNKCINEINNPVNFAFLIDFYKI